MLSKIYLFFTRNYATLAVFLIIILAAFLRLNKISDYMTFLGDEGRDVLVVREILRGDLTLLGPRASAADFYLGPIYYYFMAPFLFFSNYHPVGPAIMVALFGIATVFLVFKIGKEFFGDVAGLFAAALYAVSPLVITHSRSSWNPNIWPFFSILTLYFAYKGVENKSLRFLALSGLLLGIALQLHYLSIFLGGILVFFLLFSVLFSDKKARNYIVLAKGYFALLLGFALGFSPFLFFEIRHSFPNTKTIINFIFFSGNVSGGGNFRTIIDNVFFRLFGRLLTNFPSPEQVSINTDIIAAIGFYLTLLLGVSSSVLILYKFLTTRSLKFLLISLWLILGVLLFGLYKKPIYDYYFGFMFPLPFLLTGALLSFLFKKNIFLKIIAIVSFASLFYVNLTNGPLKYPPNAQYEQVKMIAEFVLEKTEGKPFNFALITGGNSDHAYRYIFETEGYHPVTIQNSQIDPERRSVTDQLLIICEENPCQPLGHPLWEVAGFGRAEIAGEWQVSVLKVYKLVHYKGNNQ